MCDELSECSRVAAGGVVQALAARERIVARVRVLPDVVIVARLALELADRDVVEQRLDVERQRAAGERDLGRLPRPPEPRADAALDLKTGQLEAERARLFAAVVRQRHRPARVPVDAPLGVQERVGVSREDEEPAQPSCCSSLSISISS